jgi:xylulokinase
MYAQTGMPIDGRYLAPMVQYHFADRHAEIRSVMSAKDYLLFVLTGERVTEPSTAAGYGVYDLSARRFSKELCDFWNLPAAVLPRIEPANSLAGALSDAGAALLGLPAGIPVSTGAADSVCASYAMTGLDEKVVSISFGSSAVIVGASAALRLDPAVRYLLTPHVSDGWYGREQGALWNPRLHGGIFGLNLRHSRSDIARAYLEGVFYEVRRCVEVLAETTPIESVRVCGNIVHAPASARMLSDILGRAVAAVPDKSPAAIGAALLARRIAPAAGASDARWSRALEPTHPDRSTAQAYSALYLEYVARAALCE